jgi:uncharacterized membrane protein YbhN (UPF0104 family)
LKNKESLNFGGVVNNLKSLNGIIILIIVFIGQFINWWLESLKFRTLISKTESINKWDAIKSVYAGNAIGVLTPNKVGTFIGRALCLKDKDTVSVISSTILGNIAQLTTTALFGFIGFLIIVSFGTQLNFCFQGFPTYALLFSFIVVLLLGVLFLYPSFLYKLALKLPFIKKFAERISYFNYFNKHELFAVLALSVLRYIVFSFQFILLLKLLNVDIKIISLFTFIWVLYMIVTFIPSPFLGNLGTREAVVLLLLANYNSTAEVLSASIIVWIINVAFPAISGSLILLFDKVKLKPRIK